MKAKPRQIKSLMSGMLVSEALMVMGCIGSVVAGACVASVQARIGRDRSQTIMNVRNCQQAMRAEQNMKQLNAGDAFTRKSLEQFMQFPQDIKVADGVIKFDPGDEKITPMSANPAVNGDHLWLQVEAPGTREYVGKYGFDRIEDTTGW